MRDAEIIARDCARLTASAAKMITGDRFSLENLRNLSSGLQLHVGDASEQRVADMARTLENAVTDAQKRMPTARPKDAVKLIRLQAMIADLYADICRKSADLIDTLNDEVEN